MNKKRIGSALLAVCLTLAGGASFAQSYNDRGNSRDHDRSYVNRNDRSFHNDRSNNINYRVHDDYRASRPGDYRKYKVVPAHRFYRGGYLPARYRGRPYIVEDWRGYRLSAPPRGYYWVQNGSDFILAAIATGLIAQVVLGR